MRSMLAMVVLVVLAVNYCDAQLLNANIFGVHTEELISLDKLKRHLTDRFKPDEAEVGRLLAATKNKKSLVIGDVTVEKLVAMAEIIPSKPMMKCKRVYFDSFEKACRDVAENKYLLNYCNLCVQKQRENCFGTEKDKLFVYLYTQLPQLQTLRAYMKDIDIFIVSDGEETDPQVTNVAAFKKTILKSYWKGLVKVCQEFDHHIRSGLEYFDSDASKTFGYLKVHKPSSYALVARCAAVMKLSNQ